MKIIERGQIPKHAPKKVTCYYCKSILEYTNADVKSHRNESYVECPVCKRFLNTD